MNPAARHTDPRPPPAIPDIGRDVSDVVERAPRAARPLTGVKPGGALRPFPLARDRRGVSYARSDVKPSGESAVQDPSTAPSLPMPSLGNAGLAAAVFADRNAAATTNKSVVEESIDPTDFSRLLSGPDGTAPITAAEAAALCGKLLRSSHAAHRRAALRRVLMDATDAKCEKNDIGGTSDPRVSAPLVAALFAAADGGAQHTLFVIRAVDDAASGVAATAVDVLHAVFGASAATDIARALSLLSVAGLATSDTSSSISSDPAAQVERLLSGGDPAAGGDDLPSFASLSSALATRRPIPTGSALHELGLAPALLRRLTPSTAATMEGTSTAAATAAASAKSEWILLAALAQWPQAAADIVASTNGGFLAAARAALLDFVDSPTAAEATRVTCALFVCVQALRSGEAPARPDSETETPTESEAAARKREVQRALAARTVEALCLPLSLFLRLCCDVDAIRRRQPVSNCNSNNGDNDKNSNARGREGVVSRTWESLAARAGFALLRMLALGGRLTPAMLDDFAPLLVEGSRAGSLVAVEGVLLASHNSAGGTETNTDVPGARTPIRADLRAFIVDDVRAIAEEATLPATVRAEAFHVLATWLRSGGLGAFSWGTGGVQETLAAVKTLLVRDALPASVVAVLWRGADAANASGSSGSSSAPAALSALDASGLRYAQVRFATACGAAWPALLPTVCDLLSLALSKMAMIDENGRGDALPWSSRPGGDSDVAAVETLALVEAIDLLASVPAPVTTTTPSSSPVPVVSRKLLRRAAFIALDAVRLVGAAEDAIPRCLLPVLLFDASAPVAAGAAKPFKAKFSFPRLLDAYVRAFAGAGPLTPWYYSALLRPAVSTATLPIGAVHAADRVVAAEWARWLAGLLSDAVIPRSAVNPAELLQLALIAAMRFPADRVAFRPLFRFAVGALLQWELPMTPVMAAPAATTTTTTSASAGGGTGVWRHNDYYATLLAAEFDTCMDLDDPDIVVAFFLLSTCCAVASDTRRTTMRLVCSNLPFLRSCVVSAVSVSSGRNDDSPSVALVLADGMADLLLEGHARIVPGDEAFQSWRSGDIDEFLECLRGVDTGDDDSPSLFALFASHLYGEAMQRFSGFDREILETHSEMLQRSIPPCEVAKEGAARLDTRSMTTRQVMTVWLGFGH